MASKNDLKKLAFYLGKSAIYNQNFAGTRNAAYSSTNKLRGDILMKLQKAD